MRSRSRSRTRGQNRRQPDSVGSSSAASEVRLTSTAWPRTPTPAQPDMVIKLVYDDVWPVGTLRAFPTADVTEVTMDFISQVKPYDLVQILPLYAVTWDQVDRVVLPPQQKINAYKPVDLRATRWELYQEMRQVPAMAWGRILHALLLPWHLTMDRARHRVDESAPPRHHWLLSAASTRTWSDCDCKSWRCKGPWTEAE